MLAFSRSIALFVWSCYNAVSCLAIMQFCPVFCDPNMQMHILSATYSESFQKKKIIYSKAFSSEASPNKWQTCSVISIFLNIGLCQKMWEEVVMSILIHLTSFCLFFFPSFWFWLYSFYFFLPPFSFPLNITCISFSFLLFVISWLVYFVGTWMCSYETHLSHVVFLLKLALLKG